MRDFSDYPYIFMREFVFWKTKCFLPFTLHQNTVYFCITVIYTGEEYAPPFTSLHLNKILSRPEERLIDSWNRNKALVNFNQATRKLYLRLKPTQKEA